MNEERSAPATRATITLQGGGRLAGVSRVLKVKLEAKDIEWEPVNERTLAVRGVIHSYVYFMRSGSRIVEGEGLSIPFSREIEALGVDPGPVDVKVEELLSDYDFDPMTTDFQHRITVVLEVQKAPLQVEPSDEPHGEPHDQALNQSANPPTEEDSSQLDDTSHVDPDNDTPQFKPEAIEDIAGENKKAPPPTVEGDAPKHLSESPSEPSGEEIQTASPVSPLPLEAGQEGKAETTGETRFSQVRSGPSPSADPEGEVVEVPKLPTPKPKGEEGEGGGVLVWKPFPPPIDG